MKKWLGSVLLGSFLVMLILRYDVMIKNPFGKNYLQRSITANATDHPLKWIQPAVSPAVQNPEPANQVVHADKLVNGLFLERNFSNEVQSSLLTWNQMKHIVNYTKGLPNALEAVREARVAWENLLDAVAKKQQIEANESVLDQNVKEKQCPHFLNKMNPADFGDKGYKLRIPCGLIQGSAITIIGIPDGLLGSFRIDLTGEPVPGEPDPPIVLHYNVRLRGDKDTEDPVIVQNTWTAAHDWGEEERCPSAVVGNNKKVDDLKQCNDKVGKVDSRRFTTNESSIISVWSSVAENRTKSRQYFPFKIGYLSVMTLRVGEEGFQMTVDGKHITSFAHREGLEPWLVNEVTISGDIKLTSVLASGLPTSEDLEHINDLDALRVVPSAPYQPLDLFIGVFSTANNFKRRMAVRRTWMQYPAVKSGAVAVRFFVGLHKNQIVNEELWNEINTYGDIQLMPFVDYYGLITWKTVAICIFGTQAVSAKHVMKTDDDAFVRVDEVLASISKENVNHGLLYGLINYDAQPHRNTDSKWYISPEEYPGSTYPPWAHGPGYVVSHDIAKAVYTMHKEGRLRMFKLEDVAMGIWILDMKREGLKVHYINEGRVHIEGCKDGYVVAHYQSPRDLLCLWQKLQEERVAKCCSS
ncbi:beta-1,3-galactosyltransferase GALT1-like isoform X2 [Durio zibethinus]|nr:beta-1,3-galactosyltransferase GALT1-like isoform X2 [Durio zibethinus]XP_022740005.1 beta-1,3-galactosyltransferase GALT1-like isoform X2 [Durio zibethinus]